MVNVSFAFFKPKSKSTTELFIKLNHCYDEHDNLYSRGDIDEKKYIIFIKQ